MQSRPRTELSSFLPCPVQRPGLAKLTGDETRSCGVVHGGVPDRRLQIGGVGTAPPVIDPRMFSGDPWGRTRVRRLDLRSLRIAVGLAATQAQRQCQPHPTPEPHMCPQLHAILTLARCRPTASAQEQATRLVPYQTRGTDTNSALMGCNKVHNVFDRTLKLHFWQSEARHFLHIAWTILAIRCF